MIWLMPWNVFPFLLHTARDDMDIRMAKVGNQVKSEDKLHSLKQGSKVEVLSKTLVVAKTRSVGPRT